MYRVLKLYVYIFDEVNINSLLLSRFNYMMAYVIIDIFISIVVWIIPTKM